ncbi:MAG: trehalose-phosphatase [Acidobacteriota bacterium]|nr:trehalose-phosphatase [Acidobacteriota bacterium]
MLLLDFDGTLVPVNDDPDEVSLDPLARRVLRRLARHRGSDVYIMSGRRLADLRRRVKIPGVRLLGLHGWERPGATLPPDQKRLLRQAKHWLARWLPALPGIEVEDKGYALAVHYRGAPLPVARVAGLVMLIARDLFRPGLHLLKGKQIWELLPRAIVGKGLATQGLLQGLPADTLPIFVGDDTSDESAFAILQHGLAVHVGTNAKTKATFCLRDPGEVREFLERLEAVISCKESSAHSNS